MIVTVAVEVVLKVKVNGAGVMVDVGVDVLFTVARLVKIKA